MIRPALIGQMLLLLGSILAACSPQRASAEDRALEGPHGRARFLKLFWYEPGLEHGNPTPNGRFRVNAPEVVLHPEFSRRSEARSSGMLQILLDRAPAELAGAELYVELWGGHPGTAEKRVTVNGRSTYPIPEVGTASNNATHQYPEIALRRTDLVHGHNAFQFACGQGSSFWGHFIVDNACVRAELAEGDRELRNAGLAGFQARVEATASPEDPEAIELKLIVPESHVRAVAAVDFAGFYDGYDENGDGRTRDWHGMTRARRPYGHLGTDATFPFSLRWDLTMLPDQADMGVRAVVHFDGHPELVYITPPAAGLRTPERREGGQVRRYGAADLPRPFWSRAGKTQGCTIRLDEPPEQLERAELRMVLWDGGAGTLATPWRLNGRPLPIVSRGKHDVVDVRLPIDPAWLVPGANRLELRSDTEHHGIEVLLPGPELITRGRPRDESSRPARVSPVVDPAALRRHAIEHRGSADRGKRVFGPAPGAACLACHKARGEGGTIGPDLSDIGNKYDRAHLIESVLEPSRQIDGGYRVTAVATKDGRVLAGIVGGETEHELTLTTADGGRHQVAKADVDERRLTGTSLMPENLAATLTAAEFTDLIAYLESLRPTPRAAGGLTLPADFRSTRIAEGLTAATALQVAPDGRVFVCEQTGDVRVISRGVLLSRPLLRLEVDSSWERGLIGMALDPSFEQTHFIYVCYVTREPYPHHRISRFTVSGDLAVPGSEAVLLEGDDQRKSGGPVPAGHQGGALHFGRDGKLYVALGEQTAGAPSQDLHSLLGKLLRINADGTIPGDNPFFHETTGKYRAIWALGLRNPFTFAVQPGTGRILINDVGGLKEEINEGAAGANYGWPAVEHGPTRDPRFRGPIYWYPTASIIGGAFCPAEGPGAAFPARYLGKYFFMDFVQGWIRVVDPETRERPARAEPFASGLARPVDLAFAPDGSLYVLVRDAWVHDDKFRPNTGALLRIQYGKGIAEERPVHARRDVR